VPTAAPWSDGRGTIASQELYTVKNGLYVKSVIADWPTATPSQLPASFALLILYYYVQ
jgi:hypothetical protein